MNGRLGLAAILMCMCGVASVAVAAQLSPEDIAGTVVIDKAPVLNTPVFVLSFAGLDMDNTGSDGRYSFDNVDGLFIVFVPRYFFTGEAELSGTLLVNGNGPSWPWMVLAFVFGDAPGLVKRVKGDGTFAFTGLTEGVKQLALIGIVP